MTSKSSIPARILPVIVFAQFAGTSLWFAANAVAADLQRVFSLGSAAAGDLASAVQLGFISGTLVFAVLSVADRFSPAKVFLACAVAGAFFNLCPTWLPSNPQILTSSNPPLLALRFLTGFFLAGIYPVGMKISADWFAQGLGKALGWLVGALVLGTALPHLLRALGGTLPWGGVLAATSALAVAGALLLFLSVGDGPHRKPAARFSWSAIPEIFRCREFRAAAFGYFGHMWELYAVWAFVPVMLAAYSEMRGVEVASSLWSFFIIAAGGAGCVAGGYASLKKGSPKVAFAMLLVSGACCLLSPLFFLLPKWLFLAALLVWGFSVVGDSPQFSTIVARTAPKNYVGTALTLVNCIGFALTVASIQLLNNLRHWLPPNCLYLLLLPGPLLGLASIRRLVKAK